VGAAISFDRYFWLVEHTSQYSAWRSDVLDSLVEVSMTKEDNVVSSRVDVELVIGLDLFEGKAKHLQRKLFLVKTDNVVSGRKFVREAAEHEAVTFNAHLSSVVDERDSFHSLQVHQGVYPVSTTCSAEPVCAEVVQVVAKERKVGEHSVLVFSA